MRHLMSWEMPTTLPSGAKMYTFAETAAWMLFGVLGGFTAGYTYGFKTGRIDGFVRGKIAGRKGLTK